jgi:transposase InsO family protein
MERIPEQFPFEIRGFRSDNGGEFINRTIADLPDKLLIEQTKSRPRHSNDNGLGETKNGGVIRKHSHKQIESRPKNPLFLPFPDWSFPSDNYFQKSRVHSKPFTQ